MKHDFGETICYKLQLIIDGCNGPIRFREEHLRRRAARATSGEDNVRNHYEPCEENLDGVGENGDNEKKTILSLLCPESIVEGTHKKAVCRSTRFKNGSKGRKKKNHKANHKTKDLSGIETAESVVENFNRLDMIPLLQKLLIPSHKNDTVRDSSRRQLFDSIVVLFDGVSITKRPLVVPRTNHGEEEGTKMEEEIARGRVWDLTNDILNEKTGVCSIRTVTSTDMEYQSGHLTIEITGLYDEADNVIVKRIQEYRSRTIDRKINDVCLDKGIGTTGEPTVTRIQVLRRTERGAGKNRRLFQPLGLLRSESVACVFEFGAPLQTCREGDNNENKFEEDHQRSNTGSDLFRWLALDGYQTLQSIRRQNPGNVFLVPDDAIEIPHDTGSDGGSPVVVPIVVTDDIFLRQRIVHEGGYVMTFHQFWLLLIDVE